MVKGKVDDVEIKNKKQVYEQLPMLALGMYVGRRRSVCDVVVVVVGWLVGCGYPQKSTIVVASKRPRLTIL